MENKTWSTSKYFFSSTPHRSHRNMGKRCSKVKSRMSMKVESISLLSSLLLINPLSKSRWGRLVRKLRQGKTTWLWMLYERKWRNEWSGQMHWLWCICLKTSWITFLIRVTRSLCWVTRIEAKIRWSQRGLILIRWYLRVRSTQQRLEGWVWR